MSTINKIRKDGVDYNLSTNDVYSTEEQVVGTWIDGKPLYKKTLEFTKITDCQLTESLATLDIDNLVVDDAGSFFITDANFILPLNMSHTLDDYARVYFYKNNSSIYIEFGSVYTMSKDIYVTIKYTKTTD